MWYFFANNLTTRNLLCFISFLNKHEILHAHTNHRSSLFDSWTIGRLLQKRKQTLNIVYNSQELGYLQFFSKGIHWSWKAFLSAYGSMRFVKSPLWLKDFSETVPGNRFSPECTWICPARVPFWLKDFSQTLHWNGFSPQWTRKCFQKFHLWIKDSSQTYYTGMGSLQSALAYVP